MIKSIGKILLVSCMSSIGYGENRGDEGIYKNSSSDILVMEPINVIFKKRYPKQLPSTLAHTQIIPEDQPIQHNSIIGIVQNSVGVSANGQGGRLQNFSIRGISRQRVMTQTAGVRIVTDRRAGTAANFVDPLLFDQVDIYRGAASSQFGSGALGGVVNISPRIFSQGYFSAGYNSAGDENYQMLGWGNNDSSLAISRRDIANTRSANGDELNTQYSQYSAVINQKWKLADYHFNLMIIPTFAEDTGKSNSDFPDRVTNYPKEDHLLVKLDIAPLIADWQSEISTHLNTLVARVSRSGISKTNVKNTAYDFSEKLYKTWALNQIKGQSGFEYYGRYGVESTEKSVTFDTNIVSRQTTLDNGKENEFALFKNIYWQLGEGEVQAGVRYSYLTQSQSQKSSIDEHIWAGHLAYRLDVTKQLEMSAIF